MRPLKERFEEKIYIEPNSGCWLWTASCDSTGYGQIYNDSVRGPERTHRVAWKLYNGEIPEGMHVLHKCDTKVCVRPDHLFVGTANDNVQDMINKKRNAVGERRAIKLTEKKAREIYFDNRVQQVIADEYGVDQALVSRIKSRKQWGHIEL